MNCEDMLFALKRRLGIACCWEGTDPHGHAALVTSRGGGMHGRHAQMITAWRQVFQEAGGQVPERNIERLLRRSHIPVAADDNRRLDLIVPGLNVDHGLPLFCDVTVVSPISAAGTARPGTSNHPGRLLEQAQADNETNYPEVARSGLGVLYCLGSEVYGRFGQECVDLVAKLCRERTRGQYKRVRGGFSMALIRR